MRVPSNVGHFYKVKKKGYTMSKEVKAQVQDVTEFDRTVNYIQFQISQAEEMLSAFHGTGAKPICFAHLVTWKKNLQDELHEMRKNKRK